MNEHEKGQLRQGGLGSLWVGITNRGLYINKAVDNTKIKMGKKAGSTQAVQKQKKRKPISSQKQKIQ